MTLLRLERSVVKVNYRTLGKKQQSYSARVCPLTRIHEVDFLMNRKQIKLLTSSALNAKLKISKSFVAQTVYLIQDPFSPLD